VRQLWDHFGMLSGFERFWKLTVVVQILVADSFGFCAALFRNRAALAAENHGLADVDARLEPFAVK
jgi:hypothetical protein